jgi:hypothetical protein
MKDSNSTGFLCGFDTFCDALSVTSGLRVIEKWVLERIYKYQGECDGQQAYWRGQKLRGYCLP